jgi:hypothetical protein
MWFPSENESVPSIHRMVRTDDLIVANDGVSRIISFACLHLAANYGPLRSNSNRLAWELPQDFQPLDAVRQRP